MGKLGQTLVHKGQTYTAVDTFDHERRDGTVATILWWRSTCTVCGTPFSFTAPASSKQFQPNRRCAKHKRPGQRVKEKRT